MAIAIATIAIATIVIGVGLSISTPLAIEAPVVATIETMAIAIAQAIAVATIVVGVSLSISTPLGDMDDSSRVGHIPASSSIESSYGRGGSRGVAMDSHRGVGVEGLGISTPLAIAVVTETVAKVTIAKATIAVVVGVGLRLGSSKGRQGKDNKHLHAAGHGL